MRRTPLEAWIASTVAADEGTGDSVRDGPIPALDRAALERYQLRRLLETVRAASTGSSFYRRRLAGADEALFTVNDVRLLPFTTADDIRANPRGLVCVSQDSISRVVTLDSSGTTGRPKRLYFTPADQALTVDFFRVGMSTFTAPGDRVLILLPGETPGSVGDLLATALRRIGAMPIKHGPVHDAEATLRIAASERASVMVGVPTHVLRLARHEPPPGGLPDLHSVLLSTDHVPTAIVAAAERAWGCRVYNHYGMTEMGLGGGVDCSARVGYHVREADLLFEIVDPGTGGPVIDGEPGEIVFTTLTRTGMPLIRYRTGDIGRWLPERCPCGTRLRTLAHVASRVEGAVTLGDTGAITQADLDEAVFAIDGVIDFVATVRRSDAAATLSIGVRVAPHWASDEVRDAVAEAVSGIRQVALATATGRLASIDVAASGAPVSRTTLAKRSIAVA